MGTGWGKDRKWHHRPQPFPSSSSFNPGCPHSRRKVQALGSASPVGMNKRKKKCFREIFFFSLPPDFLTFPN